MSRIEKSLEEALKRRKRRQETDAETATVVSEAAGSDTAKIPPDIPQGPHVSVDIHNPIVLQGNEEIRPCREEYNKLKSKLISFAARDDKLRSLLITSHQKQEGKSITSLNLAISLAQGFDHTVLLIDADLRNPSLHKLLGLESPKVGLLQCLRGEAQLSEALIRTDIGKLVLLPAGGVADNPVELLSSERTGIIFKEIIERYPERFVLFDTPPLSLFADASVLGQHVGGAIIVVKEGAVRPQQVEQTLAGLGDTHLVGVVLNMATTTSRHNYYYSYYGNSNS